MLVQVFKALCVAWTLLFCSALFAQCKSTVATHLIHIKKIIDGDTLILDDGARIRLIGINAPEIKNKKYHRKAEPFADQAKRTLTQLLQHRPIKATYDTERKDKYQRHLLHLYNAKQQNINALMLEKGMAFLASTPPNVALVECYQLAQRNAQKKKNGLWKHAPIHASAIKRPKYTKGFISAQGIITDITRTKKSIWLTLSPQTTIRIAKRDWKWFDSLPIETWLQQSAMVNGYFHWYNDQAVIMLRHPSMISLALSK